MSPDIRSDRDALIVVDVQNDFLPGGTLGVPEGDRIIPLVNRLTPLFQHVVFTQDWHPGGHVSFSDDPQFVDQSWPAHCVQNTFGAELHKDLVVPERAIRIRKGDQSDKEAYSGFQNTGLADQLRNLGVERVYIVGLALDYCVRETAQHALQNHFETVLVSDATRAIGERDPVLNSLRGAGVEMTTSQDLLP